MAMKRKRTIMSDLSDRTTVVVGASRGLGPGIARAFAEAGAPVVAVARTGLALHAVMRPTKLSPPQIRAAIARHLGTLQASPSQPLAASQA
jgi:NAD(P)-dependent dehydrogenase (short-subunit alcohol dehydrogenase family)